MRPRCEIRREAKGTKGKEGSKNGEEKDLKLGYTPPTPPPSPPHPLPRYEIRMKCETHIRKEKKRKVIDPNEVREK